MVLNQSLLSFIIALHKDLFWVHSYSVFICYLYHVLYVNMVWISMFMRIMHSYNVLLMWYQQKRPLAEFLMISSPSSDDPQLTFKARQNTIVSSQSCRKSRCNFYSRLNMKLHISNVCKASFFHLQQYRCCWKMYHYWLLLKTCTFFCCTQAGLRYNSLLVNLPKGDIAKLQKDAKCCCLYCNERQYVR